MMQKHNMIYTLLVVGLLVIVFLGFYKLRMESTMVLPDRTAATPSVEMPEIVTVEPSARGAISPEEYAAEMNVHDMVADERAASVLEQYSHHEHDSGRSVLEVMEIRNAAEKGDAYAQGMLGEMHHHGDGVERDLRKAFYWFRQGAEGGDRTSIVYLGRYYNGEFPEMGIRDLDMAEMWLEKLAVEDDHFAMTLLGQVLYTKVREGQKDRQREAAWWYNRGTGGGVDESFTPPSLLKAQAEKKQRAASVEE